jgi:hypothetical protein
LWEEQEELMRKCTSSSSQLGQLFRGASRLG